MLVVQGHGFLGVGKSFRDELFAVVGMFQFTDAFHKWSAVVSVTQDIRHDKVQIIPEM